MSGPTVALPSALRASSRPSTAFTAVDTFSRTWRPLGNSSCVSSVPSSSGTNTKASSRTRSSAPGKGAPLAWVPGNPSPGNQSGTSSPSES